MRINTDSETEGVNFILQTTVMCHHRTVGHIMDMRPAPCANQTKCAKKKNTYCHCQEEKCLCWWPYISRVLQQNTVSHQLMRDFSYLEVRMATA